MTAAAALPLSRDMRATRSRALPLSTAVGILMGFFALDTVSLLGFLGWPPVPTALLAATIALGIGLVSARTVSSPASIAPRTMAVCLTLAAILLLLGGEGRLFSATADWQIRDTVLADMGNNAWPFDYALDGRSKMLRAPLGMYLLPALLGGSSQIGRDWALLGHNLVLLTLLFAIGSALFEGARARIIAAIVFIAFSGWDFIGNLLRLYAGGGARWDHIETWSAPYQYSAHITQIIWVPHHAMAGWACALAFMLWRSSRASIGLFGAMIPLVALWSPLAIQGAVPFALFAGLKLLGNGQWNRRDFLLTAIGVIVAVPALLYLGTDAQKLGARIDIPPMYPLMMVLEVGPLLLPFYRREARSDWPVLLICIACLLLMPLLLIGSSADFQMRASIVPLAILALSWGDQAGRVRSTGIKSLLAISLALSSVTGAIELGRAALYRPAPAPHCNLTEAWTQQSGYIVPHDSYFAATRAMPDWLLPVPPVARANAAPPARCWDRPWMVAR